MEPVLAALFVLFGLAFGSFLNVCIYRIPRALEAAQEEGTELSAWREMRQSLAAWRSVTEPARSFCPQCGHGIRWYDNVPVVSWLVLGGRCRDCGGRISFRYTAVEALTGLLFLACYAGFGPTLEAVKYCLFTLLLVPLIFTDAEHKLLPDTYTVPGVLLGLAFSLAVPVNDVAPLLAGNGAAGAGWLSLADAALGAAVGSGFLYGVGLLYRLARGQEGMGLGDVKLMAMVGAFVGARLAVLTIFAACILGLLFALAMLPCFWRSRVRLRMRRNRETAAVARRRAWRSLQLMRFYAVPYGVFLGMAALLAVFFGAAIFHWYITRYF